MTMMRTVMAGLTALALLSAGDCDTEKPKPKKTAAPVAAPAVPPKAKGGGDHGAEPAPVQGDPSAHNTKPGELDLEVDWSGENRHTPSCLWRKNGAEQPCANMEDAKQDEGAGPYFGYWNHTDQGRAGDHYYLAAEGWRGTDSIECYLSWKSVRHHGVSNGRRCSIDFVLN